MSLVVVLMILMVVSVLGIGGIRIATMTERGTHSNRDMQLAWQAAEAALVDSEFDITGQSGDTVDKRSDIFERGNVDLEKFVTGCGNSGKSVGLCTLNTDAAGNPAWLVVDFGATGSNARSAEFGQYTGRQFPSGSKGIQPAKPPRYVIESIPDPAYCRTRDCDGSPGRSFHIYRVTAMGFGPHEDTQAVLQIVYR